MDGRPPACRRHPANQYHRRHHQLREPRNRPADARVRSRYAGRPCASRAPCAARRDHRDARRGGASSRCGDARHRRSRSSAGRCRRYRRRRLRGVGSNQAPCLRERLLPPCVGEADQQAPRCQDRSVDQVRARCRHRRAGHGHPARRGAVGPARHGHDRRGRHRLLPVTAGSADVAPAARTVGPAARRLGA